MNAHPGFKAVQGKIEKEGYSKGAAGAILASRTRNASAAAKKKNPRLNKVKSAAPKGPMQGGADKMAKNMMEGY